MEVFQVDKNKEKIVTRTNNEGWKMGAETISLCCGEHYIILPGCDGEIQSVVSGNRWTSKNGNIYEPHGCLKKGIQWYLKFPWLHLKLLWIHLYVFFGDLVSRNGKPNKIGSEVSLISPYK